MSSEFKMTSRFKVGDRVRLSALGRHIILPQWSRSEVSGVVIEIGISRYEDVIRVKRDRCRPGGATWAGYWELDALDNMVGYAGSSSTISVSDLSNKR